MTVNKMVEVLKGDSAFWINKQRLVKGRFEWHDEYFAVSVSESGVADVRKYIHKQQSLHQRKTFRDECLEFMKRYGFRKGK
jgi:REP element-mobilizing transposase RayT